MYGTQPDTVHLLVPSKRMKYGRSRPSKLLMLPAMICRHQSTKLSKLLNQMVKSLKNVLMELICGFVPSKSSLTSLPRMACSWNSLNTSLVPMIARKKSKWLLLFRPWDKNTLRAKSMKNVFICTKKILPNPPMRMCTWSKERLWMYTPGL